jgi:hypothetical protein
MQVLNDACNVIAEVAFREQCASKSRSKSWFMRM